MVYVVEYRTAEGVGRFAVKGADLSDVLARAEEAVLGLNCLGAVLRFLPSPRPVFGEG